VRSKRLGRLRSLADWLRYRRGGHTILEAVAEVVLAVVSARLASEERTTLLRLRRTMDLGEAVTPVVQISSRAWRRRP
jgi:hypothetical protein